MLLPLKWKTLDFLIDAPYIIDSYKLTKIRFQSCPSFFTVSTLMSSKIYFHLIGNCS